MTNIVTGAVSTVTELGKDEAWMATWLSEQPARLGLGDMEVAESAADDDDRSFVGTSDDRCFSVDVQLGEMEASRGFGVLDNWARNRVLHPDKTHVAVLVTEAVSDRYETTLETLAEHLPLVVVELQVWKGENEAIVIPHVALSSEDVDLSDTPAVQSADALAKTEVETEVEDAPEPVADAEAATDAEGEDGTDAEAQDGTSDEADTPAEVVSEAEAVAAEAEAQADADSETGESKDDTGVGNPWGLSESESESESQSEEEGPFQSSGNGSTGLLSKVG